MFISRGSYVKSLEKIMLDLLKSIYTTHIFKSYLKKLKILLVAKAYTPTGIPLLDRCKFAQQHKILRFFLKSIQYLDNDHRILLDNANDTHSLALIHLFTLQTSSVEAVVTSGFHHCFSSAQHSSCTLWSADKHASSKC